MSFEKVVNLDVEYVVKIGGGVDKKTGKKNPDKLEGYFLGKRLVPSPKSKTGESTIYVFQTPKGNIGAWGTTNLDQNLSQVLYGTMTRVTFTGMKQTKNNPMYMYLVEQDKTNIIEVTQLQEETLEEGQESYSGDNQYEAAEQEDSDYESPEVSAQNMIAAKERAAKVQAMLNKNKKVS